MAVQPARPVAEDTGFVDADGNPVMSAKAGYLVPLSDPEADVQASEETLRLMYASVSMTVYTNLGTLFESASPTVIGPAPVGPEGAAPADVTLRGTLAGRAGTPYGSAYVELGYDASRGRWYLNEHVTGHGPYNGSAGPPGTETYLAFYQRYQYPNPDVWHVVAATVELSYGTKVHRFGRHPAEIAYLGDYDRNLVDRNGRPFGPFAAPVPGSPLRGEAVAYLLSGAERVFRSAAASRPVGLMWIDGDGKVSAVQDFWSLLPGTTREPGLDLFRVRALDFAYVRRPPVPGFSGLAGSAVVLESGYDTAGGVCTYLDPSDLGGSMAGWMFPGWGTNYAVCQSQSQLDGNGGNWLAAAGAVTAWADVSDWKALCKFAAYSSAPPADFPCPLVPGGGGNPDFARGYAMPGNGTPAGQAEPEGLLASDVAGLFRRPSGDPAAMTRAWAVGRAPVALSAERSPSFSYTSWAERHTASVTSGPEYRAALAGWRAKFDSGGEWEDGPDALYSVRLVDASGAVHSSDADDMFDNGVWPTIAPTGDVAFDYGLGASYLTPTSGFDGIPTWSEGVASGSVWLLSAYAQGTDAYPVYTNPDRTDPEGTSVTPSPDAARPMNYQADRTAYPWYKPVDGVTPDGFFDIPFRGSAGDRSADPSGVPCGRGDGVPDNPLSLGGAPRESPDDAAYLPLCIAHVRYGRNEVCDGAVLDPGTTGQRRTKYRSWTVCVPAPAYGRWTRSAGVEYGAYRGSSDYVLPNGPSGFAAFVGEVLAAVGDPDLPDPTAPVEGMFGNGASTWSWEPAGGRYEVVEYDAGRMNDPGYQPAVVATYPQYRLVTAGHAPDEVHLAVSVEFYHGLFESGYCA